MAEATKTKSAAPAPKRRPRRKPAADTRAIEQLAKGGTVGSHIAADESEAIESIRADLGADRTSTSYLVRLAIVRFIREYRAGRVSKSETISHVRVGAKLDKGLEPA